MVEPRSGVLGKPSADRGQFNNEMHSRLLKTIKINKNKLGLALLKISLYDVKSNKQPARLEWP